MPQQLHLFAESAPRPFDSSEGLLEQTRQLFQHQGSNRELMAHILKAIYALREIGQPIPK